MTVVADLNLVIDLNAVIDHGVIDGTSINCCPSTDPDVIADAYATKLGNRLELATFIGSKTKPVRTQHGVGMNDGVMADLDPAVEHNTGTKFYALTQNAVVTNNTVRVNTCAVTEHSAVTYDNTRS